MALSAPEVRVGITGELFSAPRGTTLPINATSSLDPALVGHGYLSNEGVMESWDDSIENIIAWQNATIVRAVRSESIGTLQTTLIQTRGSNLELFYPGSSVEPSGGEWALEVVPALADPRSFVLNVVDGAKILRLVVPNGEVTERGEVPYQNSGAVQYPITITFYPDESGVLLYKYSNDDAWGIDVGS